jgi:hypothetical protein
MLASVRVGLRDVAPLGRLGLDPDSLDMTVACSAASDLAELTLDVEDGVTLLTLFGCGGFLEPPEA